ncbi:MAG: hypothetical protein KAS04_00685 [Candidatus Aenigmarchaeota archaeon]|nr:hypothetical protein [Candidatus Aenigmarchaeota archaeon]
MSERQTHYLTKFWNKTHPLSKRGQIIADKYLHGLKSVQSAPRGTKVKLNRLGSLMHRHYRFYNDGDAFTYRNQRVGMSSGRWPSEYYYNIENDNKLLRQMENEMAELIGELWILTNGATK